MSISDYPCPVCGAKGIEHCFTLHGKDHVARWHLHNDIPDLLKLIEAQDIGFRETSTGRRSRHIWEGEATRRPLTSRERKALDALLTAGTVRSVYAVGNRSRGHYERVPR